MIVLKRIPASKTPLFFMILYACLLCGCPQSGGPTLPQESIGPSLPDSMREPLTALYQRDADDVIKAINAIADMGEQASAAIPYLSSMLTDSRLGTLWVQGYGKTVPVSQIAALALGSMGSNGIRALADALTQTEQIQGMEDDLLRESVAHGLKHALSAFGENEFQSLKRTQSVDALIRTTQVCRTLDENPGRFDPTDPRKSLKYYKHFDDVETREGLETYLTVLGMTGDIRALTLLESIYPLASGKKSASGSIPAGPFETAAVIAQYRIDPIPFDRINPACTDILMVEFTAKGDLERLSSLLSQGADPDTLTPTGHPLIELAFKMKHPTVFEHLITSGAKLDLRLAKNDTLLIRASREGNLEFVQALLAHGPDPALTDNAGETALDAALAKLLSFWNGKPYDTDAKPFFKTIELLQDAGSPPANEKIVKDMDKKSKEFLKLE